MILGLVALGCTRNDPDHDGFSAADGDCDDGDSAVYPGAPDTVGDGVDSDCDGSDGPGRRLGQPDHAGSDGLELGADLVLADLDADGDDDVIVGATHNSLTNPDQDVGGGLVEILDAPTLTPIATSAPGELLGEVVGVGDVTGDSRPDVVAWTLGPPRILVWPSADLEHPETLQVGPPFALNPYLLVAELSGDGRADLVLAPVDDGVAEVRILRSPIGPDLGSAATVLSSATPTGVGQGLAAADLDGDGVPDLVIGTPDADRNTGRVDLHLGPVPPGVGKVEDGEDSWGGDAAGDWFGLEADRCGDVDGDGLDDVAIGAIGWPAGDRSGRVTLVGRSLVVDGDGPRTHFGRTIAGADLDGDGADDLVVGAPSLTSLDARLPGRVSVFLGPLDGHLSEADADVAWAGSSPGDMFGSGLGSGDVNGDGHPDVVIGAEHDDFAARDGGAVYSVLGPVTAAP